jgi:amino acid transporter
VAGFLDAASLVFGSYGSAGHALLTTVSVLFVFVLMTQGSAWMIVSDRMQAMAAADGGFFSRALGAFHPRLGTPVRMNLLSGVTATFFMLAATLLVNGSTAAVFKVVLTVAVTTLLLSYLAVIPALGTLRRRHGDVPRPYRVPGGAWGFRICLGLVYLWIVLGSWVALFPGVLERVFGVQYDFEGTWGVSRTVFETFTLGTVAVLLALGVLGRVVAARLDRARD